MQENIPTNNVIIISCMVISAAHIMLQYSAMDDLKWRNEKHGDTNTHCWPRVWHFSQCYLFYTTVDELNFALLGCTLHFSNKTAGSCLSTTASITFFCHDYILLHNWQCAFKQTSEVSFTESCTVLPVAGSAWGPGLTLVFFSVLYIFFFLFISHCKMMDLESAL